MSDRDGVLPFPGGPAEPDDEALLARRVAALYAVTPTPAPDAAARCAAQVLARAAGTRRADTWALPRRRWWWGAAAAAVLVAVTTRPWRAGESSRDADSAFTAAAADAAAAAATAVQGAVTRVNGSIQFEVKLPAGARDVALVGDFNGWDEDATPMERRAADGTWSARVSLAPGRHVYAFVVDGQRWLVDPLAPQVPDAGFGPANAVVVGGPR